MNAQISSDKLLTRLRRRREILRQEYDEGKLDEHTFRARMAESEHVSTVVSKMALDAMVEQNRRKSDEQDDGK